MAITLPEPMGEHAVGIRHISFTYAYKGTPRDIPVYLYYPADDMENRPPYPYGSADLYRDNPDREALLAVETRMAEGLALSAKKPAFPLTLFNVGFGCFPLFNSVLCCDLASSGFVVASIGHPGDCSLLYPDGRVSFLSTEQMDNMMDEARNKKLATYLPRFNQLGDSVACIALGKEFFEQQPTFNAGLEAWVADTAACLNWLESLSFLQGRIDWTQGVSVGGHSYGGSAAIDLARADDRIVCGINLDGGNFGYSYGKNIGKPFLSLGNPNIWGMLMAYTVANQADSFFVRLDGVEHMGFTDFMYIRPEGAGVRKTEALRQVVSAYYLAFLEVYQTKARPRFERLPFTHTQYFEKRG